MRMVKDIFLLIIACAYLVLWPVIASFYIVFQLKYILIPLTNIYYGIFISFGFNDADSKLSVLVGTFLLYGLPYFVPFFLPIFTILGVVYFFTGNRKIFIGNRKIIDKNDKYYIKAEKILYKNIPGLKDI